MPAGRCDHRHGMTTETEATPDAATPRSLVQLLPSPPTLLATLS